MTWGELVGWYELRERQGKEWGRTKKADLARLKMASLRDRRADSLTRQDFINYIETRRAKGGPCYGGADLLMGDAIGGASIGVANGVVAHTVSISADETREINRAFSDGKELVGSAETVIANMSYRDDIFDKAATAIRDIAGGHLFGNGTGEQRKLLRRKSLETRQIKRPYARRRRLREMGRSER